MRPRLLLFDLYTGGHHRAYLEMLARAWVTGDREGRLEIAAPQALFDAHPDFLRWIQAQDPAKLSFLPVSLPEPLREGDISLRDVLRNDLAHGRALREVLASSLPEETLLMYFDHCQASLALRRIRGASVSGIYFRPSFHYPNTSRATGFRKRSLLSAALTNRCLKRVLTLDPFAVDALSDQRFAWLPDGLDTARFGQSPAQVRDAWGVGADSKVLLFFGVVSARKGIHELLAALASVRTPVTLVIVGRIPDAERPLVEASIQAARASGGAIVLDDRYVRAEEIQDFFHAADVATVAYRHHVGSSNVLIRAAAAGVPVVGPTFGLMGRLITEHHLGAAVDPADTEALAEAIDRMLAGMLGEPTGFDPESAAWFAQANSEHTFAETVFREVLK
ncbi:MAG: glycosyltransferase involved in cell wall biosynthesis [Rhodothermales bacterium]|jgi:glycosyltransferase involved in cell wall biosynthesis